MKAYSVLVKQNNLNKIEDIKVVKEGFSMGAFLFSGFWFLYHKMYKEFFVLIVFTIILNSLTKTLGDSNKLAIEILFIVIIAFNANYWLVQSLNDKSYKLTGMAFGRDDDEVKIDVIKNLDDEVFDEKYLNPSLKKNPNFLKKFFNNFS